MSECGTTSVDLGGVASNESTGILLNGHMNALIFDD
jgi:hypothetical protein